MNPWPYLIAILVLSIFQSGLYLFSLALDAFKLKSSEKLAFYRVSVVTLIASPALFFFCRQIKWRSVEIAIPFIPQTTSGPAASSFIASEAMMLPTYLLYTYAAIVAFLILWIVLSYSVSYWKLSSATEHQLLEREVWLTDLQSSPFCFGLFAPRVFLPKGSIATWSKVDQRASVIHEMIHAQRRDPLWKALSLLARAVLFFSPTSYLFHRKFDVEMEIYCDAQTMSETGLSLQEYGGVLLRAVLTNQPGIWLATNMNESNLRRRILAMKLHTKSRPTLKLIACVASLVLGLTAVAATSGIVEKKEALMISAEIYLNGEKVSMPRIITLVNERASISQLNSEGEVEMKLDLLAYRHPLSSFSESITSERIQLDMNVFFDRDGVNVHAKPQLLVIPGEEALIEVGRGDGTYAIKLTVTPHN